MWLNPCAPLVSVATWREALAFFLKGDHASLTAVRELGGWFYDREGRLLNDTGGNVDTVEATPILQVAHAFHVYDRARMLESGRPWPNAPGDPYLYPIPEAEAHDIDTEDEFAVVEYLYRKRQGVEP
jgi:CMP-N-acetylneuraminic acid synthetase